MGASYVAGTAPGAGSAEATAKGPKDRGFVGVEKLIGPRVVAAGRVALVAGTATITFEKPLPCVTVASANAATPTPDYDYAVMLFDETTKANNNAMVVAYTNSNAAGDTTVAAAAKNCLKSFSITITGGSSTDVIKYVVVKVGEAE